MDFWEKIHDCGLELTLVLPNVTADTQEIDQVYIYLKRECDVITQRIAGMNIAVLVQACKKSLLKNMLQPQFIQL